MYASTAPPSRLAAALGVVAPTWQGGPPSLGPGIAQRDLPRRSRPPRPPPSPTTLVALCFAATTVAYIERTGFAIALADAASGERERSAGAALSYFYWGYALSQIPGAWAAQRWGGPAVLAASFAVWPLASALTPLARHSTPGPALAAARGAVGVAQGVLVPAVHAVLAAGLGPAQRAAGASAATSGLYAGAALATLGAPAVVAAAGPGAVPRGCAVLGLAWLGLWLALGLPPRPPRPPSARLPLATPPPSPHAVPRPAPRLRTPWRALARHPAVAAIVACNFAFHWAFYLVMNWAPLYRSTLLRAPLQPGSVGAAAPYVVTAIACNAGGWASGALAERWGGARGVGAARKAVNSAGFLLTAAGLLAMPRARSPAAGDAAVAAVLGAAGLARGGFAVNHLDIAPSYAAAVMGISNTAGTLAGVVGTSLTGALLQGLGSGPDGAGWAAAAGAAAAACVAAAAAFAIAGRGDRLFGDEDEA